MTDDDRPSRHPAIETAVFEPEAVLYDERSGMVHHLNATAYAIWALLDGRPLGDVVVALSGRAGVPPDELQRDVIRAIGDFRSAGLLRS